MLSLHKHFAVVGVIILLAVGLGSFYVGTKYGQQANPAEAFRNARSTNGNGANFQRMRNGGGPGGGAIVGEVLSKDDTSITLKLRDNGSKIVFFSSSTAITKSTQWSLADLNIGDTLIVSGTANPDGSVTAQTIQLRPPIPAPAPIPETSIP